MREIYFWAIIQTHGAVYHKIDSTFITNCGYHPRNKAVKGSIFLRIKEATNSVLTGCLAEQLDRLLLTPEYCWKIGSISWLLMPRLLASASLQLRSWLHGVNVLHFSRRRSGIQNTHVLSALKNVRLCCSVLMYDKGYIGSENYGSNDACIHVVVLRYLVRETGSSECQYSIETFYVDLDRNECYIHIHTATTPPNSPH